MLIFAAVLLIGAGIAGKYHRKRDADDPGSEGTRHPWLLLLTLGIGAAFSLLVPYPPGGALALEALVLAIAAGLLRLGTIADREIEDIERIWVEDHFRAKLSDSLVRDGEQSRHSKYCWLKRPTTCLRGVSESDYNLLARG